MSTMSSLNRLSSSSLPSHLAHTHIDSNRTPSPSYSRRRPNSHLTSSIFQTPPSNPRMTPSLSYLPTDRSGEAAKGGEVFYNEWPIRGLKRMRDHVEGHSGSVWAAEEEMQEPEGLPEGLQRGVVMGGGWYKLDLARTIPPPHSPNSTMEEIAQTLADESKVIDTLSLYIAAQSLDSQSIDCIYPATIFVGIKALHTNIGARYAETRWFWHTSSDWDFSADNEYWETQLPKLSELLEYPDIKEHDGLVLCVHIASPASTRPFFTLPDQIIVPKRVINSLNGLVDSQTGDVKFVCLEHVTQPDEVRDADDKDKGNGKISTSTHIVSRKRVLYAHSEVLTATGDYFHDLVTGGFSEAEGARRSDSRYTTILVDDAGFKTVYSMLSFMYTNQLIFASNDDVRHLMNQLHLDKGSIAQCLSRPATPYGPGEWDYRRLPTDGEEDLDGFDARTIKSVSSVSGLSPPASVTSGVRSTSTTSRTSSNSNTKTNTSSSAIPVISTSKPRSAQSTTRSRMGSKSSPAPTSSTPTKSASTSASSTTLGTTTSPQGVVATRGHYSRVHSEPDPHAHPCTPPAPASALSVYILSHRYRLEALESLAKDHILGKMTPENCMPMLLATYQYDDLHSEVLDFVVDHWPGVQSTDEFFKCIQEVSSGVWGEAGGLVIHGLFRRL